MILNNGTIPAWWARGPSPGNFGDIITPILIEKLFGFKCVWTARPFNKPVLLGIGSILNHAENETVVWGSGAMRRSDPIKRDAKYLCVRGPHTRDLIIKSGSECPSIYGDPALLLPRIFLPDVSLEYTVGLIPHYVDYEQVSKWYANDPQINVINVLNSNPLAVAKEICKCENIISSSLHGLIVAHAYGIPTVWAKHSDKLGGDGIKFQDHLDLVGIPPVHFDFYDKLPIDDLTALGYKKAEVPDMRPVIKVLDTYLHG